MIGRRLLYLALGALGIAFGAAGALIGQGAIPQIPTEFAWVGAIAAPVLIFLSARLGQWSEEGESQPPPSDFPVLD